MKESVTYFTKQLDDLEGCDLEDRDELLKTAWRDLARTLYIQAKQVKVFKF